MLTKILSVLRGSAETVSVKRKHVKKKDAKDGESVGEEIIDLNCVLHSLPKESAAETGSRQWEVGGAIGNHDDNETSVDGMDKAAGTCVYVRDDIPDDEFEQMLGGVKRDVAESEGAKEEWDKSGGLLSLVVVPTRELAFQVQDHLKKAAKHTDIKVGVIPTSSGQRINLVWKWVCCCSLSASSAVIVHCCPVEAALSAAVLSYSYYLQY